MSLSNPTTCTADRQVVHYYAACTPNRGSQASCSSLDRRSAFFTGKRQGLILQRLASGSRCREGTRTHAAGVDVLPELAQVASQAGQEVRCLYKTLHVREPLYTLVPEFGKVKRWQVV